MRGHPVNYFTSLVLSMNLTMGLHSQPPMSTIDESRPANKIKEGLGRAETAIDYVQKRTIEGSRMVWSLREQAWLKEPSIPRGFSCRIKGARKLDVGKIHEYQIAGISNFEGTVKQLWMNSTPQPYKIGPVYFDDAVEIEWDIRVSPGIRIISLPDPPRTAVRCGEPVVATLKFELTNNEVQHIQIYTNTYRDGKLVGTSFIGSNINGGADLESSLEDNSHNPIYRNRLLSLEDIDDLKRRAAECHRVGGLRPGEFVTEVDSCK